MFKTEEEVVLNCQQEIKLHYLIAKQPGFKISVSGNQNNNKIKNKTILSHYTDGYLQK